MRSQRLTILRHKETRVLIFALLRQVQMVLIKALGTSAAHFQFRELRELDVRGKQQVGSACGVQRVNRVVRSTMTQ